MFPPRRFRRQQLAPSFNAQAQATYLPLNLDDSDFSLFLPPGGPVQRPII